MVLLWDLIVASSEEEKPVLLGFDISRMGDPTDWFHVGPRQRPSGRVTLGDKDEGASLLQLPSPAEK